MKIIGLLGGVASGKSYVAEQLRRLGAEVLDADRVGHEVLRLPEVKAAIRNHFGPQVFDSEGEVVRPTLAAIVFAPPPDGPRQLAVLEAITHPEIRRRLRAQTDEMAARNVPAAVLDAPVMLKAGWAEICDALVFVDAPEEMRKNRTMARGWTAQQFAAREAAQEPVAEKRRLAEFVIDNSGSAEYTYGQIERLWHSLVG
jgi:dephospho-CoA kinase